MVEVALPRRHPTTRVDARAIVGFDRTSLPGGGAATGDPVGDDLFGLGVGDRVPPLGFGLALGDLSCDVGDYGAVAGKLAGVLVELGEGGEVDVDVDDSSAGWLVTHLAGEQSQGHIGT